MNLHKKKNLPLQTDVGEKPPRTKVGIPDPSRRCNVAERTPFPLILMIVFVV
jgi:hypothetical protein